MIQVILQRDENLEDDEHSVWSLVFDNDQLRALIEAGLLWLWEVAEEANADHSMIVQHLKQFEKERTLSGWSQRDVTLGQVRETTIMSRIKCVIASIKMEDAIWNEKSSWF